MDPIDDCPPDNKIIRAEIIFRDRYQVGEIVVESLPALCTRLLAAGFDHKAEVRCFRLGQEAWDLRAKSIQAAAAEHARRSGQVSKAMEAGQRVLGASTGQICYPQRRGRVFHSGDLVWHGRELRLRSSQRLLGVVKPDPTYPGLYRPHLAPDYTTDLTNLSRAKDAALGLALAMLNRETATREARRHHKPKERVA